MPAPHPPTTVRLAGTGPTGAPAHRPGTGGTTAYPGSPFPLGATLTNGGTNFAVVADSDAVDLCLIGADDTEMRLPLQENTFGIWHTWVPEVGAGQRYGYRLADRDPAKLLLDPYARRLDTTDYDLLIVSAPGVDTLDSAPLGVVTGPITPISRRPEVPWAHTVIYEAHVKGATALHPGIPQRLRGTYLGLSHPTFISHLTSLGVTALELLPVHAHIDEPGLAATGRQNYWGYSTLGFFAPHPAYASRPGGEVEEFVTMVDRLHEAGIEVILDVVYNHTGEGGSDLPVPLSFRGLSPDRYYLPNHDITGTGNTLNPGRITVIRMILDSLRYWAELGVDGFRFDLASVLGRPHGGGFNRGAPLLAAIAADPVLATRKLIAEPWDATGEGYAVGRFDAHWTEWNDKFRDTVRDFWRGVADVQDLGYRLSGSQDLYGSRRPWASINFVTAHDGFTLRDLVSYNHKHNEANGEHGRDGTDNNRSFNYGVEGETTDHAIGELRHRQARNLMATLLLSTGTPMITMGDEMWRTQQGNNNAYCQDNEISWTDWSGLLDAEGGRRTGTAEADMFAFTSRLLGLRADSPALRQSVFFEGRSRISGDGIADLVWFTEAGVPMEQHDWWDGTRRTLMMWIDGRDARGHSRDGRPVTDDSWLLVLHAGTEPIEVTLPEEPYGTAYAPVLDTSTPTGVPEDETPVSAGIEMTLPGRTLWLLRALGT